MITVFDDDAPELKVSTETPTLTEAPNLTANFKVSAEISPNKSITLLYDLTETGDFIDSEGNDKSISLDFSNSAKEALLPITIIDDEMIENSGTITVSLDSDTASPITYTVAASPNDSATITVTDDDAPVLNIRSGGQVVEAINATADFVVSTLVSPDSSLTVYYNLSESHSFIANEGTGLSSSLDFTNGKTEATLEIPITSDDQVENNGTVTVTLIADQAATITYLVASSPNDTAIVNVIDDDSLPIVSIAADSGDVAESTLQANFMLTATRLSGISSLTVSATVAESKGDYLTNAIADSTKNYPVDFTDPDGDGTFAGILEIDLDDDTIGEATGEIRLTLNPDNATYKLGSTSIGVITVYDDDAPELRVTAGPTVAEANAATADFEISSVVSPNKEVNVRYNLTESQNFIVDEGDAKSVSIDFRDNNKTGTLSIDLTNDRLEEANGTVTVTLIADDLATIQYTVAESPRNTASVQVIDDDSLPYVSIIADSGAVAENDRVAEFKLSAVGLTATSTLIIKATPAENGSDFLSNLVADTSAEYSVEFTDSDNDNTYDGMLSVALDNDNVGEATGSIKLTLNENSTVYRFGASTEGLKTIWDDDAPELTIAAGNPVVETTNAEASFVVSANISPNDIIAVRYDLSESGDFIDSEGVGKAINLDFSNQGKTATIPIAIFNDTTPESDGTITVLLIDDNQSPIKYTAAAAPDNSASLDVFDDDSLPKISIKPDSGTVSENAGPAMFNLIGTGLTQRTVLTILAISSENGGDYLTLAAKGGYPEPPFVFTDDDGDNIYSATIPVNLDDDNVGEATSEIKLTLQQQSEYRLGPVTEGVITVLDDDAPELKIAAGSSVTEAAGATADFEISTAISPNDFITVGYRVAESHAFTTAEGSTVARLDFTGGKTQATLSIPITSDSVTETNGTITVTLLPESVPNTNYTVASVPNNEAMVNVYDDDPLPIIVINGR